MKSRIGADNPLAAYAFLAPAILGLLFLTILPTLGVVGISLTNWSGLSKPAFIGLANFKDIFTDTMFFYPSVVATLYFALGSVVVGIVYAFSIAFMLNRNIPARAFFRSVFFLPYVVPTIGATVVWAWMYEANFGVFNFFLSLFGIDKVRWLGDNATATPSLIVMTVWGLGNMIVIFLAGLQNVPRAYLEAVEIDGGNGRHKFIHVTLPMMSPIIFFNFLMSTVTNLQVFVPAYSVTKGAPNNSTLYMAFMIYREGFRLNNFGRAAAVSLVFFIFIGAVTALIFATSRKWLFMEGE